MSKWINYTKHTAASQCIIDLAVWAIRKDVHIIFSPYMQKCNHVRILNGRWVWLLILLSGCGDHGNGEERLGVVEEVGHFL